MIVGGGHGEGDGQRPLGCLVEGHGQVPFVALQTGYQVVPVGVDEIHLDLQHLLAKVPAQLDEVAAVGAGLGITHHIRRRHSCATTQYAGFLHVLPE
ncbi:hypothetical protein D3C79_751630 [compost metagenome]